MVIVFLTYQPNFSSKLFKKGKGVKKTEITPRCEIKKVSAYYHVSLKQRTSRKDLW